MKARKLTKAKADAINRKREMVEPTQPSGGSVFDLWGPPRDLVKPGRAHRGRRAP